MYGKKLYTKKLKMKYNLNGVLYWKTILGSKLNGFGRW
jgi:hypothetical protein